MTEGRLRSLRKGRLAAAALKCNSNRFLHSLRSVEMTGEGAREMTEGGSGKGRRMVCSEWDFASAIRALASKSGP